MPTAIVVGGGHNGLVAAVMLQTKGFKVTVLEQKQNVGGACAVEVLDGQPFNWGANHLFMLFEEVIVATGLDLRRLVLKQASPDAEILYLGERVPTLQELTTRYNIYDAELRRAAEVFRPHLLDRNSTIDGFRKELTSLGLSSGSRFLDGSVTEVLQHYFPSEDAAVVRQVSGKILSFYPPSLPGSAIALVYLACANEARFGPWSSPLNGMGSLVAELCNLFEAGGGNLKLGHQAVQLVAQAGQIKKVRCANGTEFFADFVVASMPSVQLAALFEKNAEAGTSDIDALVEDWSSTKHDGGCSKMMIRASAPLKFRGAPLDCLKNTMLIYSLSPSDLETSYREALLQGHSERPYWEVFSRSLFNGDILDEVLYSVYIMYSSFGVLASLSDQERASKKEALANVILAEIENVDKIVGWDIKDPVDLFETFGLSRGNVDHGLFVGSTILDRRKAANFEISFRNLICCSPGFAAGGLVSGLPGYLAALKLFSLAEGEGNKDGSW